MRIAAGLIRRGKEVIEKGKKEVAQKEEEKT